MQIAIIIFFIYQKHFLYEEQYAKTLLKMMPNSRIYEYEVLKFFPIKFNLYLVFLLDLNSIALKQVILTHMKNLMEVQDIVL